MYLLTAATGVSGLWLERKDPGSFEPVDHLPTNRLGNSSRHLCLGVNGSGGPRFPKGKKIEVDATTLEANAALKSLVRRDTGESYGKFLAGLAKASGIETPTREGHLMRCYRKSKYGADISPAIEHSQDAW